jgi:hypothetical protein
MLKSLKKIDNKIASTIKHNYVKYGLVLALLLLTIKMKSLSMNTLTIVNKEPVLLGLGLVIVYLVYVDIVLALVATLCVITLIQEYNARRAILHMNNSDNVDNKPGVDVETDVLVSTEDDMLDNASPAQKVTNLANQMASMTYVEQPTTPEFKKHMRTVAPSTYGSMTETELLVPTGLKYENQIGNLDLGGVGQDMHSDADEKFQDFKKFAKVNMGQSVVTNPVLEGFTNMDTTVEAKQYDHPSSKTMTEMMRVQGVDYINEKNLEMIQSNNAKLGPVPCAVESICGSMNVQSF